MRRERHAKLVAAMETQDVDVLVLLGESNVRYATGAHAPAAEIGRATLQRPIAVVTVDGWVPHVFSAFPEGLPPELPPESCHGPLPVELGGGGLVDAIYDVLGGRPVGVVAFDEYTMPLYAEVSVSGLELGDASAVMGAAKLCKTFDELACIREAQRINDTAMDAVRPLARPGVRQTELTAAFLRRIRELCISSNCVDPVWQVMPARVSSGPYSTTGDVVFPTATTDRILREGDVIWTDTGCNWNGYASDHGRTWLVSRDARPDAHQVAQYQRWRAVVDRVLEATRPGATGGDLVRAACVGEARRPWLPHFYLVHGIGTDPAEAPLIGTDLGSEFDESIVLVPGMVMVLEPVIWEHGHAGYRSEDVVAVTETGWIALSHDTYHPFPDD